MLAKKKAKFCRCQGLKHIAGLLLLWVMVFCMLNCQDNPQEKTALPDRTNAPVNPNQSNTTSSQSHVANTSEVLPSWPKGFNATAPADGKNFVKNPVFEELISSHSFGQNEISVEMISPQNSYHFSPDNLGKTNLRFAGIIEHAAPGESLNLNFFIFNNVDSEQPILKIPISTKANADGKGGFERQQRVFFQQGQYYFTLKKNGAEALVVAGKFLVKN